MVVLGFVNNEQDFSGFVGDLFKLCLGDKLSLEVGIFVFFLLNFICGLMNVMMYLILFGLLCDENFDQVFLFKVSQLYVYNMIDVLVWWFYLKKDCIYWDGMVFKMMCMLMQFIMVFGFSGEKICFWEDEFEVIYDYIDGFELLVYFFVIDCELVECGKQVFESVCFECYGIYGVELIYLNCIVLFMFFGIDLVWFDVICFEFKVKYNKSWFVNYGEYFVIVDV